MALELVKGVRQNLPDITLAADDEFRQIASSAWKRQHEESAAIVNAIRRKNGEK